MKLLIMADQKVGFEITRWLLKEFLEDVALVVVTSENEIWEEVRGTEIPCVVFESNDQICSKVDQLGIEYDVGILAWWPMIIKKPLIDIPSKGFINTHPSLLPYNRGKHYNFWALVEQAPFGVSLHLVDDGVDSGDVISQKIIDYDWEDNGETLYHKAQNAMVALLKDTYPVIRKLTFRKSPQNLSQGSFHRASELDAASEIELDRCFSARDLLNLLRARTFTGHPSCWFSDGKDEFQVQIEIKRKKA